MVINFRIVLIIALIFTSSISFSQTIKGKIENIKKEPVILANVLVKDCSDCNEIKEFSIARNGQFSIKLKQNYSKIVIEIKSNGYQNEAVEIINPIKGKVYVYNFMMVKEVVNELKEVVVVAEKKAFIVKKDTVSYNVSSYRDGSERKIQDIIKKLPGVDVDEKSGEIRYKGKPVETVKLEGDDLFGQNYSLGTKNINVDMVEKIEAIENYHDNPLLKDVENDDKVALNLKLKKGKTDFSGNVSIDSGLFKDGEPAQDLSANVLGISKNYKSFGTFTYNNIGRNNSPYDYFSSYQNVEQLKENEFYAKRIISDYQFENTLDEKRVNINNQIFGNYNAVFKLGSKVSLKTNVYYIKDKLSTFQNTTNRNLIAQELFVTSDDYSLEKQPVLYRGDLELKINTSPKSLLEYKCNISQENIDTPANLIQNSENLFQTDLQSKSFFLKNNFLFTQQLSGKKVLQLNLYQVLNDFPQELIIYPSTFNNTISRDRQISNFKKETTSLQVTFLGSARKIKYNLLLGGILNAAPFESSLSNIAGSTETLNEDYQNDRKYSKRSFFSSSSLSVILNKFKLTPTLKVSILNQSLKNRIEDKTDKREAVFLEPNLSVQYKIDEVSALMGTINYSVKPFSEDNLFSKPILVSSRVVQSNSPTLELQKTMSYGAFYLINNLYKQFQLRAGLNYFENYGGFFSNADIQENRSIINFFYLNQRNSNFNGTFHVEKYVSALESTIRLTSNYTITNYKNVVNNSELRNNDIVFVDTELFFKTAFDVMVNFENVFQYNRNIATSNDNQKSTNSSLNNTFKVIVKPFKNWFISFSSDYFVPNVNETDQDCLFLDANFRFKPKNKKFEFGLDAQNILNQKYYSQTSVSDYSTTVSEIKLLPMYVMLKMNYSF